MALKCSSAVALTISTEDSLEVSPISLSAVLITGSIIENVSAAS
jgi:hypothetical protein